MLAASKEHKIQNYVRKGGSRVRLGEAFGRLVRLRALTTRNEDSPSSWGRATHSTERATTHLETRLRTTAKDALPRVTKRTQRNSRLTSGRRNSGCPRRPTTSAYRCRGYESPCTCSSSSWWCSTRSCAWPCLGTRPPSWLAWGRRGWGVASSRATRDPLTAGVARRPASIAAGIGPYYSARRTDWGRRRRRRLFFSPLQQRSAWRFPLGRVKGNAGTGPDPLGGRASQHRGGRRRRELARRRLDGQRGTRRRPRPSCCSCREWLRGRRRQRPWTQSSCL